MKYFNGIRNFEQAKKQYRTLAKKLHTDQGGSKLEFQEMQQEYRTLLLKLKQGDRNEGTYNPQEITGILNELHELGKNLLKYQIPQKIIKKKIQDSQNPYEKLVYEQINIFLDRFS